MRFATQDHARDVTQELTILLVDDDSNLLSFLQTYLVARGHDVLVAQDAKEALRVQRECWIDLMVSDVNMPGMNGISLLEEAKRAQPDLQVVIITGKPEVRTAVDAIKLGAIDYLSKPFTMAQLESIVDSVSAQKTAHGALAECTHVHGRLDDFEIVDILGEGARGLILLGERFGQHFAIKALKVAELNGAARERSLRRFEAECQMLQRLHHPNIVGYVASGIAREERVPYLATEFVDARSLRDLIDDDDVRFQHVEVLALIRQLADALAHAHAQGIVHRDVKPANVLVDVNLDVTLVDFGVAAFPEMAEITLPDRVVGTPGYMAPEAFETSRVDHRADLFSLGVLSYELLAGERPFKGGTFLEIAHHVHNYSPRPLNTLSPDIPGVISFVVEGLLVKEPEARIASAAAVVECIDDVLSVLQEPNPH